MPEIPVCAFCEEAIRDRKNYSIFNTEKHGLKFQPAHKDCFHEYLQKHPALHAGIPLSESTYVFEIQDLNSWLSWLWILLIVVVPLGVFVYFALQGTVGALGTIGRGVMSFGAALFLMALLYYVGYRAWFYVKYM